MDGFMMGSTRMIINTDMAFLIGKDIQFLKLSGLMGGGTRGSGGMGNNMGRGSIGILRGVLLKLLGRRGRGLIKDGF